MVEKYVLAEKDYRAGMKYKDIAAKYDVSLNTVKSWKQRKWSNKDEDTTKKGVHTKQKRVHTKKEPKEPVVESDELTEKQRLFCIYYIKYFNATKAYQKAYGVNRTTAESIAYRLMGKDGVKTEIQRLKQQRFDEAYFDKYDVLQKYKDIAFADITDFITFSSETLVAKDELGRNITDSEGNNITYNVNHVDFKNSEDVDGTIITEVKKGKDGVSIKLADKMKALEMLAKYTDLLSERELHLMQTEKVKADAEFAKERAAKLKGQKKDTSLLDALVEGRKQYEQSKH